MKTHHYKGYTIRILQCSRTKEYYGYAETECEIRFRTKFLSNILFEIESNVELFLIRNAKSIKSTS